VIVDDVIEYCGGNENSSMIIGDIFIIKDFLHYDDMSVIIIKKISTKESWGIDYTELRYFKKPIENGSKKKK